MNIDVYPDEIPSSFPYQLNTSTFCPFVPDMCKEYPDYPMMLHLFATQYPTANLSTTGAWLEMNAEFDFYVTLENGTNVPMFNLAVTAFANGSAYIVNGTKLSGILTYLHSNISLLSSNIGTVRTVLLQVLIDAVFTKLIIPALNEVFAKGLQLPSIEGVSFTNPEISYAVHSVLISTAVTYNPSSFVFPSLLKNEKLIEKVI